MSVLALFVGMCEVYGADAARQVESEYTTVVRGKRKVAALPQSRATSTVTRDDLQTRLPRSAPDALIYEPGIYVQQTAHGQASAYIRGLTGQQTLLLFDGIRLNNATYRNGPNQYFFTVDTQTVASIEALRGGASTRFGSDALGGVLLASPVEPTETTAAHVILRGGTADHEYGGRLGLNLAVSDSWAFYGGVGGRDVGRLKAAGALFKANELPGLRLSPTFAADGKTQLGTGFNELTADGRLNLRLNSRHDLTLAAYTYRQGDAPRTDQCPPPEAPQNECLIYDDQFRNLVYARLRSRLPIRGVEAAQLTLSWQQQRERRTLSRPRAFTNIIGRDVVDTFGLQAQLNTTPIAISQKALLRFVMGVDAYFDRIDSASWTQFTDLAYTRKNPRGQYISGADYLNSGVFVDGVLPMGRLTWLAGTRLAHVAAHSPGDPESTTVAVDANWSALVGHLGVKWHLSSALSLRANLDRSFRAPNLDDMTSRQQTGPGLQLENAFLRPEAATMAELGVHLASPLTVDLWFFHTWIDDAIVKVPIDDSFCPEQTPDCVASRTRIQLTNTQGQAHIYGVEGYAMLHVSANVSLRITAASTRGYGPNPLTRQGTVPLSRIPPTNATAQLIWRFDGLTAAATLRTAAKQDALSFADRSDARIPIGGTPGFTIFGLRASYRYGPDFLVSLSFENIGNTPYRHHGSSVNGAMRSLTFYLDVGSGFFG